MHPSTLLLGLTATASAIDIRLYLSRDCTGGISIACVDAEQNRCCGGPNVYFGSVGFAPVPSHWYLDYRGHTGGQCAAVQDRVYRVGVTGMCLVNGPFSGGGYSFAPSSKRDVALDEGTQECLKPDVLEVEGAVIGIKHLSEARQAEIFEFAAAGAGLAAIRERMEEIAKA